MAEYAVGVRWSGGPLDKMQMQWSGWQERMWHQQADAATQLRSPHAGLFRSRYAHRDSMKVILHTDD
jgi:hypothetical protein